MDLDGNRFVWNGAGDIGLYAFGTAFSRRLEVLAGGIPSKAQFIFGGEGTLYANDVDGRVLRAIVPQYTLSPDFNGNISSPTHLRVVGTAGNTTVLKAAGSVLLGPGFTVKLGATLTIGKP